MFVSFVWLTLVNKQGGSKMGSRSCSFQLESRTVCNASSSSVSCAKHPKIAMNVVAACGDINACAEGRDGPIAVADRLIRDISDSNFCSWAAY